jgi:hypothetical protein
MKFKWILVILLILAIFLSGCDEKKTPVKEFQDDALKFEYEVEEQANEENILPGQDVRMVIYLTSQVHDEIKNTYIRITNPYGIKTNEIRCYYRNCECNWNNSSSPYFNGCYINDILGGENGGDGDIVEVYFSLKMPTEEELSPLGRDLKPELTLKYDFNGTSTLYIPVLRETEQPPKDLTVDTSQTKGPIHVDLKSGKWVRSGQNEFPLIVDVKDVLSTFSSHQTTIYKGNFRLYLTHLSIMDTASGYFETIGAPKSDIIVPLKNPLVATLKADSITTEEPLVRAMIMAEYSYTYEKKVVKNIRVEKALA